MLEPIADEVWGANAQMRVAPGLVLPIRMTVVRLPGGALWLCAPIPIDDALAAAIDRLGPVRHAVGPSLLHHVHLGGVVRRWPEVSLHGAPGLAKKRPDLAFASTLGEGPAPWDTSVLTPIPWRGETVVRETVFVHRPTGTLIAADVFMNVHEGDGSGFLLAPAMRFEGTWNQPGVPRLLRLLRRDRGAMAESARRVLEAAPRRIVPGHGRIVDEDATPAVLERGLVPIAEAG